MPEPPLSFSICHDSWPGAILFGWDGIRWRRLESQAHHSVLIFKFSKRRHGMDSGFTSSHQVIFRTALQSKWFNEAHNHSDYCQGLWKRFSPSSGSESVFVLTIEDPLVETTTKQGVLPQVIALVGNLGGYLSLSGVLFTLVWVRRYPRSEVAKTFEARTLFGHSEDGEPGGTSAAAITRASSNRDGTTMTMTPVVMGSSVPNVASPSCREREQQMPDRPHGTKASE